ncbi:MAG: alpha-beta hydrolase superfamily lysophospholipase [Patiriisocius sp.]|jgi:alpha-beta hydrolase superfamily lysophospholipase
MPTSSDGFKLHTKNWLINDAKASLILVHGLGEHSARYEHVASALNNLGVNVYSFDLRGHGLSEGPRAFIKNISEYRTDLKTVYDSTPKDLPLCMLGHSMGGLIVTDFLLHRDIKDIKAVILTGPALEPGDDITPFKKWLIRALNWISPNLRTIKVDPTKISREQAEVEKYINDPLMFTEAGKAGIGVALLNSMADVKTQFCHFNYPLLIMHGEADQITNPDGSKALYNQSPSKDKTLKIWDDAFHEVFNETNKTEVIAYMTSWLSARI